MTTDMTSGSAYRHLWRYALPLLLGTLIQTSLRVVFTMLLAPRLGILGIAFACAGGWCVMLLVEVPLYLLRMRGREGAA